jgi:hypothetical protein
LDESGPVGVLTAQSGSRLLAGASGDPDPTVLDAEVVESIRDFDRCGDAPA